MYYAPTLTSLFAHSDGGCILASNSVEMNVVMKVSDLIKATIVCALIAYLVYTFPVLGQVLIIAFLSLLWLSYLYRTVLRLRSR
jgi:uncharacterized membrane protein YesL